MVIKHKYRKCYSYSIKLYILIKNYFLKQTSKLNKTVLKIELCC